MNEVNKLLLKSAEDSFLQVGVFVGAMLLLFGYINYKMAGGLVATISRNKRLQVPIGALLGVSPGCGGAIFIMPLYVRGVVTFGTTVATLLATMGDSSFVIISRMPKQALYIHLISLSVGIVVGYMVDALGIAVPLTIRQRKNKQRPRVQHRQKYPHLGHQAGDKVDLALHPPGWEVEESLGYQITHRGYGVYWVITGIGFVVASILLGQRNINQWVGFDLTRTVGLLGAAISVVWLIAGRHTVSDDTHSELEEKTASLRGTFIHTAHETAFVTFWVFVAYSAYGLFMYLTQIDLRSVVAQAGVLSVIATACIGLIPGCGPQVLTVTLYTKGVLPFSALVSHTLSQDGDALFPLLAMNVRAALLATIITTIPAIIVGMVFFYLGF